MPSAFELILTLGPVSLVVTTTSTQVTSHIQSVFDQLVSSARSSLVSIHLLHLEPTSQAEAPNAYLNVARLFAATDHVLLFPGNLTLSPPPLTSLPPVPLHSFLVFPRGNAINDQNFISTANDNLDFPFTKPTLAPILTRQDMLTWCTERGSALHLSRDPASRRILEWNICLWQLWLDNFGDVEISPSTERAPVDLRLSYQAVSSAISFCTVRLTLMRCLAQTLSACCWQIQG